MTEWEPGVQIDKIDEENHAVKLYTINDEMFEVRRFREGAIRMSDGNFSAHIMVSDRDYKAYEISCPGRRSYANSLKEALEIAYSYITKERSKFQREDPSQHLLDFFDKLEPR